MASHHIGQRAVVLGAGIGGLTAAGALADHFEQVVVLERDALPPDAAHRAGTPQSKHIHGLLGGGQRALGQLFPGFEQDLERAGAVPIRVTLDVRIEMPGYDPFPQRDLGFVASSMSRPLIESLVRRRVERHANVTCDRVAEFATSCPQTITWRSSRSGPRMPLGKARRYPPTWSSTPPGAAI